MKFRDIKNLDDFIKYCKLKNTKWSYTPTSPNPYEIDGIFFYYSTPLAFVVSSGEIYYLEEYTKDYFISTTTCWYLSHLKNMWRYSCDCKDFIGLENYKMVRIMKDLVKYGCIFSIGKLGSL